MFQIKLQAVRSKLTKSEIKIADYIIENIGELKKMNSYELARKLGIGQATSVRFAKKLGYKTFKDLTNEITEMNYESIYENEINIKEDLEITNIKIVNQYKKIIDFTHDINTSDDKATKTATASDSDISDMQFLCDTVSSLEETAAFIHTLPNVERIDILPYHTLGTFKYEKLCIPYSLKDMNPPSKEWIQQARDILKL